MSQALRLPADVIPIRECEAAGHAMSPEIDEGGYPVLDPVDALPREDGLPHAPGQFVKVCPRCLLVEIVVYGEDGKAAFNWFDYENAVRMMAIRID